MVTYRPLTLSLKSVDFCQCPPNAWLITPRLFWKYLNCVLIYLFFQQWQQFCATASTTCWRQTPTLSGRSPGFVTQMQVIFFSSCLKIYIPINPIINVQLAAQQSPWRHWTSCARRGTLSTTSSQRTISSRLRWDDMCGFSKVKFCCFLESFVVTPL